MMRFLNLPVAGRRAVIERQKESVGLPGMSIEKDLWVTQVLHALFSLDVSDFLRSILHWLLILLWQMASSGLATSRHGDVDTGEWQE